MPLRRGQVLFFDTDRKEFVTTLLAAETVFRLEGSEHMPRTGLEPAPVLPD